MFGNDNMFGAGGVSTGFYDKTINQSLRFNDNDSARLSRTPSTAGNRRTWTWSGWIKRGNLGSRQTVFQVNSDTTGTTSVSLEFFDNDRLYLWIDHSGYWSVPTTTQVFRDTSAWYHVVVVMDTTQSTASNRTKFYVNGELAPITFEYSTTYISQNADLYVNATRQHNFGVRQRATSTYDLYGDLYLAEVNFVDGQALTADSFGEYKSGVWIPKAYSGSYGTNGFHLEFANSGSLGTDTSGNGNNWSAYNLASTDQMLDSPTNNFATFSAVDKHSNSPLAEGNLFCDGSGGAGAGTVRGANATIGMDSGKYYWEMNCTVASGAYEFRAGIRQGSEAESGSEGDADGFFFYRNDGSNLTRIYEGTSFTDYSSYYGTFTNGDIIMFALDADTNEMWIGKNGSWFNNAGGAKDPATNTNPDFSDVLDGTKLVNWAGYQTSGTYVYANFGQDSSFAGNKTAQGNTDANGIGDFYYAPPSGYLALCTANLPEPAISPLDDASPSDHFNTILYTGTGATSQAQTGVGFAPDLVWTKARSYSYSHIVGDQVRGANKALITNATDAETTQTTLIQSFDSDGFTVGNNGGTGYSGTSYVAWNWKANGSGSTNTDGSITSTVSANQDAGFSIVSYTGNGTQGASVGHGLGNNLDCVIIKDRSGANNWAVAHSGAGVTGDTLGGLAENYMLVLNSTDYKRNNGSTVVGMNNSSYFTIGNGAEVGQSGHNYIAYCFHSVEGYSKFGSYTGNGSTDGAFVYTGFRPAFVLWKNVDSGIASWHIMDAKRDSYNVTNKQLKPNSSNSEQTVTAFDALSNGFKWRDGQLSFNASGQTYIYMAFAENPFKYTTAR